MHDPFERLYWKHVHYTPGMQPQQAGPTKPARTIMVLALDLATGQTYLMPMSEDEYEVVSGPCDVADLEPAADFAISHQGEECEGREETLTDFILRHGFADEEEFNYMVASVDLTVAGMKERFFRWQHDDGTKTGLQKLLDESLNKA